jgi:hypothetical protein
VAQFLFIGHRSRTMTHLGLYFSCVFGGLLAIIYGLVFFARATQWKPKPLKPVWGISFVCLAVLIAGMVCSIAGRDIHILYWWLLGAPAVAIGIPLVMVSITLLARLFMRLIFRFFRAINNHDA